jgi:hypothetical protein
MPTLEIISPDDFPITRCFLCGEPITTRQIREGTAYSPRESIVVHDACARAEKEKYEMIREQKYGQGTAIDEYEAKR